MNNRIGKSLTTSAIVVTTLLIGEPALAFRCGSKIVRDGMHEQQVLAICGQPASVRHLGYAIRAYDLGYRRRVSQGLSELYYPGYGYLSHEVVVTEYVYNFGPRKLMRRLIFEGSVLRTIETIGYGYIEKDR